MDTDTLSSSVACKNNDNGRLTWEEHQPFLLPFTSLAWLELSSIPLQLVAYPNTNVMEADEHLTPVYTTMADQWREGMGSEMLMLIEITYIFSI